MFNLFRRHPPSRYPTPPWVKWLVIGLVLYAMLANQFQGSDGRTRQALDKASTDIGRETDALVTNVFSPGRNLPQVEETSAGKGNPPLCGQDVAVAYTSGTADGSAMETRATAEKPYRFRIGFPGDNPTVERLVQDLRVGGKRTAEIPRDGTRQRYALEVVSITPELPPLDTIPFRLAEQNPGSGTPILCGQEAKILLSIWDINGKKIFHSDKPIVFTPGLSQAPLGMEQGVLGLRPGGMRTLIVPPVMQKTMSGAKASVSLPFPPGQTVIIDIAAIK